MMRVIVLLSLSLSLASLAPSRLEGGVTIIVGVTFISQLQHIRITVEDYTVLG